jgi:gp32 DNA binding protein like
MSNQQDALQAMLAQYEENNKPRFEKTENKNTFDEKNYFTTFDLAKDETTKTKEVRLLPNPKGGSPIIEFHGHTAIVDGVKRTFPCLQYHKDSACPFCEAREALLATGEASDKELAKKYNSKKMYIAKVIDRANEADGPKFWRFNNDYTKKGVFDLIHGVVSGLKKNKDISSPTEGRDLSIIINRNQTNVPIVSSIVAQDSDVLSTDKDKAAEWLAHERTWEDGIYSVKSYDYLAIIVKGYTPIWDKEEKCFVAKELIKETENEDAALDAELTMSAKNVKENMIEAEPETAAQTTTSSTEDGDDLPF